MHFIIEFFRNSQQIAIISSKDSKHPFLVLGRSQQVNRGDVSGRRVPANAETLRGKSPLYVFDLYRLLSGCIVLSVGREKGRRDYRKGRWYIYSCISSGR